MRNKNTFITLMAVLTLGSESCYGAAAEEQRGLERKTVSSVTEVLREKFGKLKEKLAALEAVKEDKKVLAGLMDENLSVVQGELRDLVRHGVAEFQVLTGLVEERGHLRVKKAFHQQIVQQYEEGLRSLGDTKNDTVISLVKQRTHYYGSLMNLYENDSANFSTVPYLNIPGVGAVGGVRYIFSNNPNLVFLMALVEEEEQIKEARALLKEIQKAAGDSSEKAYESYQSERLNEIRKNVTGELSLVQLQEILAGIEEKELVMVDPSESTAVVTGDVEKENLRLESGPIEDVFASMDGKGWEEVGKSAEEAPSQSSADQPTAGEKGGQGKCSKKSQKNREKEGREASHVKYKKRQELQKSPWT